MGMNVLTDRELKTGYTDDDLGDRVKQSYRDYEDESWFDAKRRKAEQDK